MRVDENPLYKDPALFDMYMTALDRVPSRPEIKGALEDFGIPGSAVRSPLLVDAHRVLSLAPLEYAAYVAEFSKYANAGDGKGAGQDLADELDGMRLTWVRRGIACAGALMILCGAVARWWDWSWIGFWAGGTAVTAAIMTRWLFRLRIGSFGKRVLLGEMIPGMSSALVLGRDRLIGEVTRVELLAQVRILINTIRGGRFDHAFSVISSPGLSEVHDSTYNVSTRTVEEVETLIRGVSGISLGIAGPRGSGKSTIVRQYCAPTSPVADLGGPVPGWKGEGLRCMVSAPVDYAARDFVLHLFATFCRSVIAYFTARHDADEAVFRRCARRLWRILAELVQMVIRYGLIVVVLLWLREPVAAYMGVQERWIVALASAIGLFGLLRYANWLSGVISRSRRASDRGRAGIVTAARRNLLRVRFLQSRSLGWASGIKLLTGVEGQVSGSLTQAEQPLSYPEVVEQFRSFAHRVATFAHSQGQNVFVGVDELDKIGSADQAERFLNEIKGIFGVPHVYFMISVSDDALMAFERRGIPVRDAFDSSFDEIVRVGLLDYAESRRLLYRRVIGLSEPYIALCHVMSGGLARDLIRSARQLVRIGNSMMVRRIDEQPMETMDANQYVLVMEDVATQGTEPVQPSLGDLCPALVRDELARKARAIGHALSVARSSEARHLEQVLYDIGHGGGAGRPPMEIVDTVVEGEPGEPLDVARFRFDFAAYAYFCATLYQVFGDSLDGDRTRACADRREWPGSFDALANARHAFMVDSRIAWTAVTAFRRAWGLEERKFHP
ncbi:hypothetical protein [Sphaerisporangium dianthi]|uniref:KAP NTPase domain-containing protein n=1 Tax=Sphaerisporangium dianthi TaxID=1436120 RepID=A0ABV9C8B7_9ACTN